ncbi:MAG: Gfo/Idh/MocA family oxidoreductase [Clostridia bacterium]|nr:Gfo/Idh/MocA family oxidoreductase [Clostridia bacterium]
MKKARIGVLGGYRGASMINYCKRADNAEVVAICDNNPEVLEVQREAAKDFDITFYDNFEDFIKHDMDAVVLANFANEHAPFAIRAMKEGKHVFSEVLPVQTMKEAVELVEAVEETGMIYAYGENYCYMPAPYEMKLKYQAGEIGEIEYAEGEYIHNCESIWPSITYGEKDHWRNKMYSTFYCTHSLGPIIHITGLRPVSVIGIESGMNERHHRMGSKSSTFGIEMVTLENGAIVKSIHGGLYTNNVWFSIYGGKGHMESGREAVKDINGGYVGNLTTEIDEFSGKYAVKTEHLKPLHADKDKVEGFGHGGSDYLSMYNFVEKILGNEEADIIDVYEAMDMFLPGMFAYRSILDGSKAKDIPNLRNKEERDAWRHDTACTDEKVAGAMLLPTCKSGTPEIDDAVYDHMKELWDIECTKKEGNYRTAALNQGSNKK